MTGNQMSDNAMITEPVKTVWVSEVRRSDLYHTLRYWLRRDEEPSEAGYRVADLLDTCLGGLHHLDRDGGRKAKWTDPDFVSIEWRYPNIATFDGDILTRLVFLAHDRCIRIEFDAAKRGVLCIYFHPRQVRVGRLMERHPTLENRVTNWRESHDSR